MNQAAAKNDVQAVLEKYLSRQKAEYVADEILDVIQDKYCNETANEAISNSQKFETITIEGSDWDGYIKLLSYDPESSSEERFRELLAEAIKANVKSFKVPVCDPSINEEGKLQFIPGAKPAVNFSFKKLERIARDNGVRLGKKNEYLLFLGTMILRLKAEGLTDSEAWRAICYDSKELGHYADSIEAQNNYELTGSRNVAGKCDLGNTRKVLARDEEIAGFWIAGGDFRSKGVSRPLANLFFEDCFNSFYSISVGWFVFD